MTPFSVFGRRWVALPGESAAFALLKAYADAVLGFRAYRSTNQSCATSSYTVIVFDTEGFDFGSYYNNATGAYTPPAGMYLFTGAIRLNLSDGKTAAAALRKNGTTIFEPAIISGAAGSVSAQVTGIASANGTDAFTLAAWHNEGSAVDATGVERMTFFSAYRIGDAP